MTTVTPSAARAAAGPPGRLRTSSLAGRAGVFAVMALFALYTLIPVWWLLVTATKNSGYLFTTNGLWFSHFDLWTNIRDVFQEQDGIFARWLLNSATVEAARTEKMILGWYVLAADMEETWRLWATIEA